MRRKIVKHGNSTLTISLPSKWIQENGIKQGDELEIIQIKQNLMIGTSFEPEKKEIFIDLSNTNGMLSRIIAGIYKAGIDKVTIKYQKPEEFELIQQTIYRYCHVYEIINVDKNQVEIKSISKLNPVHFNQMFKKSAQACLNIGKETSGAIQKNDYNALSNIILKDRIVDRYTAFGSRIINKGYDVNYQITGPLYFMLDEIEINADTFKKISKIIVKNKIILNPYLINLLQNIIEVMEIVYSLIFNFTITKLKALGDCEQKVRNLIESLNTENKNEILIFSYLIFLFENTFEMKNSVITLHVNKTTDLGIYSYNNMD